MTSTLQKRESSLIAASPVNLSLYGAYCLIIACSSMFIFGIHSQRFFVQSVGYFFFLAIPVGGCLFFVKSRRLRKVLANKALWLSCILLVCAFDELRYVKRVLPHPELSTSASALMQPATNLLAGKDPYALRLPDGAPVSPGPGWIILLAPITLAGGAGLLTGLATCVVAFLIAEKSPEGSGIFVLLVSLQPVLIEMSARGTDLFAIPLTYAALCLLAEKWSGKYYRMILLGGIAGVFAQSRLPMVILLCVLGLGVWRRNRKDARLLIFPAVTVCVAMYLFFYLWTVRDQVFFQPLHLIHREKMSGLASTIIGTISGIALTLLITVKLKGRSEQWILAGGLLLLALFVPTGLGELRAVWGRIAYWEGASYISFGASLIASYLALTTKYRESVQANL